MIDPTQEDVVQSRRLTKDNDFPDIERSIRPFLNPPNSSATYMRQVSETILSYTKAGLSNGTLHLHTGGCDGELILTDRNDFPAPEIKVNPKHLSAETCMDHSHTVTVSIKYMGIAVRTTGK